MKVRMLGFWQECAPVAPRRAASENRIEIPADLLGVAIPTEEFQWDLQLRVPAAGRPNGRGRYQTEIDTLLMLGMAKDPHLEVLVVRRYFEFEIGVSGFRERDEQFHDVKRVRILSGPKTFVALSDGAVTE
jgi:hypothetical protein